jgi:hypothetical protein
MTYLSKRGEFDTLQQLRCAYLQSDNGGEFWIDPGPFTEHGGKSDNMWLSEIGKCPRAVGYRLLGTKDKPRSSSSIANRQVMFWAGDRFQYLTYSALNWAGLLESYEQRVEISGWSGRYDAIFRQRNDSDRRTMFEQKTVLPNALKYRWDMPKRKDLLQASSYTAIVPVDDLLLEYADRAGANTPKECPIAFDAQLIVDAQMNMVNLEQMRERLPELPDILEQTYAPRYKRDQTGTMVLDAIDLVTPWDCGYCDYHLTKKERRINPASGRMKIYGWTQPDSVCKPHNAPPVQVASWSGGKLQNVRPGHEDAIVEWMKTKVTSYVEEEEE